jgi:putative phosphoribosyl transferase
MGLMAPTFRDRVDAGIRLASALRAAGERDAVVVLGLPRGGVVVAAEVARELGAPLDVLVVRKVGVPGHEELAAGAVASGGTTVVNDDVLMATGLSRGELEQRAAERHRAVEEMERRLRGDRAARDLAGATAVLVDDGLATGATMRAAAVAARQAGAARVVVAAPVASPEAVRLLEELADEVVCLSVPSDLRAVGLSYRDFSPVREEEVWRLLQSGNE